MNKTYHINLEALQDLIKDSVDNPISGYTFRGFVFTPAKVATVEEMQADPTLQPRFYLSPVYSNDAVGTTVAGDGDIIRINATTAPVCPYPPGYPKLAGVEQKDVKEGDK